MKRIAILGSTRGTNLTAIVEAIQGKQLDAKVVVVVSNKSDAPILKRARSFHLIAQSILPNGATREDYDEKVSSVLRAHQVDLVVLVGYMRILSSAFVNEWKDKIINVHPSLLPAYAGKMDMDVHEAVLADGEKETGCTVHYVTEQVDAGPILLQKKCEVLDGDTAADIKKRVQHLEGAALVEAIQGICTA